MELLQIIYSTAEDGQMLANFVYDKKILNNKQTLIDFAKSSLISHLSFVKEDWMKCLLEGRTIQNIGPKIPELTKLSCCVISNKGSKLRTPKWYVECNGKIWYEDLNPGKENPYT